MKNIFVVGARKSGVYAAILAKKRGFSPFVSEISKDEEVEKFVELLEKEGIPYEIGKHSFDKLDQFDITILSPGVPLNSEIVQALKKKNIPIIGEMEFAYEMSPKTAVVSITGTNGKSTTTALTGLIFEKSHFNSVYGGNLGMPYSELLVHNSEPDVAVLETSCFQLETIKEFHPKVAVFLNLTEDHLNRYKDVNEYFYYKKRIFENQNSDDFAVLNYDDEKVRVLADVVKSRPYFFSVKSTVERGTFIRDGKVAFKDEDSEEVLFPVSTIRLRGEHNLQNVLASVLSAKLMGVDNDAIKNAVSNFTGLPHRLENVREIDGVLYVNDSKATTPDSVIKAFDSFSETIVLIAGGSSKNNDFSEFAKHLNGKVRKLILIGETSADIANAVLDEGYSDIVFATSLEEAVDIAHKVAKKGDVVLLSPGCASFDMFKDFEDRGNKFKKIVRDL